MNDLPKHPAPFSKEILPVIAKLVEDEPYVFDMFSGTGSIVDIAKHGFDGGFILNEIEPEWLGYSIERYGKEYPGRIIFYNRDFFDLYIIPGSVYCFATSPTYGNRFADSYTPKDNRFRVSYKFCLGRDLSNNNSGNMQWGWPYRVFHYEAWKKVYDSLMDGGSFVLNVSDHIRNKKVIRVSWWHLMTCLNIGFSLDKAVKVKTKRFRRGENSSLRVENEWVLRFIKNPL